MKRYYRITLQICPNDSTVQFFYTYLYRTLFHSQTHKLSVSIKSAFFSINNNTKLTLLSLHFLLLQVLIYHEFTTPDTML
ncbi:unnamed protein product [Parnassius mnemosyne]|uniref:Uncharacterized protein n=1 Tax=Parnassius mnemosyne TaxID=213953 RepID=A0AAV1KZQ6_9NEOP